MQHNPLCKATTESFEEFLLRYCSDLVSCTAAANCGTSCKVENWFSLEMRGLCIFVYCALPLIFFQAKLINLKYFYSDYEKSNGLLLQIFNMTSKNCALSSGIFCRTLELLRFFNTVSVGRGETWPAVHCALGCFDFSSSPGSVLSRKDYCVLCVE